MVPSSGVWFLCQRFVDFVRADYDDVAEISVGFEFADEGPEAAVADEAFLGIFEVADVVSDVVYSFFLGLVVGGLVWVYLD